MTNDERDALLQGMAHNIGEIKTAIALNTEKVKRHEKTLYGNGTPGLCTRLQRVEDAHEGAQSSAAAIVAWVGAVAALLAAGAVLFK